MTSVVSDQSSSSGFKTPVDYNLISANIFSGVMSPMDVRSMIVEVSYFEDLFGCVCSGNCVIHDAQGLFAQMQFTGNEYIRLCFGKTDDKDHCIDKMFRIYKSSTRDRMTGNSQESYVLHFCSDELLLSEQSKVSKSYSGKNVTFIIKDILKNYLLVDDKKMNASTIEDTRGIQNFTIPDMTPFETINFVAQYGMCNNNQFPVFDMLFFENKHGYAYVSLTTLMKQNIYYVYDYRPKNQPEGDYTDPKKKLNNIISFEVLDSFDTLSDSKSGKTANKTHSIDPLMRTMVTTNYNSTVQQAMSGTLNQGPTVNNVQNRFGKTMSENYDANTKIIFGQNSRNTNEYIKTNEPIQKMSFNDMMSTQRRSLMELINSNRVKVVVGGDPDLCVGKIVYLNIYNTTPQSGESANEPDPQYSGKYLVSAVRHLMNGSSYYTMMECIKDSVKDAYYNVNNNSVLRNNVAKGII